MRRLLREAAESGRVQGDMTGLEDAAAVEAVLAAVKDA
jgi:acetyl-CoA synthetase